VWGLAHAVHHPGRRVAELVQEGLLEPRLAVHHLSSGKQVESVVLEWSMERECEWSMWLDEVAG